MFMNKKQETDLKSSDFFTVPEHLQLFCIQLILLTCRNFLRPTEFFETISFGAIKKHQNFSGDKYKLKIQPKIEFKRPKYQQNLFYVLVLTGKNLSKI